MARGRCSADGDDEINATRTVWNFEKPAWNVREFSFGGLVGTLFLGQCSLRVPTGPEKS